MMATVLGRSLRQLFVVRAVYMQVRYDEIPDEMKNMLIKVGSKLDLIGKDIPVLSVPGWMSESPTTCPWWEGVNVFLETTKFHVETLYDVLDEVCKVLFVLLIEIPQLQISKFLRILKSRLSQGTHSSESFGAAPVRQVAPAEMLEVVELESPLPAESPVQVYVTAPVVVAPPVVMEYVQLAPVVEYVTPAPAVIHAAPAPGVEKVTPDPTVAHTAPLTMMTAPATVVSQPLAMVLIATWCALLETPSNFVIATDCAGSCVCCLWSMQTNVVFSFTH